MNAFLSYLVMTIVSLGLVYVGYVVALRSETFFRFNRFYLLSGLLASLLLPLAGWMGWLSAVASWFPAMCDRISDLTNWLFKVPVAGLAEGGQVSDLMVGVPEYVVYAEARGFSLEDLFIMAYVVVSLFMLGRFCFRLYGVWSLKMRFGKQVFPGYSLCWVPGELSPFSFFNTMFLPLSLKKDACQSDIVLHEMVHMREGHSFDVLLLQWLRIFFWFNPFLYLLDKALRESHEFQADARVLRGGLSLDSYQNLLLRHLGGAQSLAISNNFNYSLIKRRLTMFTRKSNRIARCRSICVLPLVLSVMCLFASVSSAREVSSEVQMTDAPLLFVEMQPEFPGGQKQMIEFLKNNLKYPDAARTNNIQGTVVLSFIVETDGTLSNITVLRSVDPLCDEEAKRVVSLMPKWKPGMQSNQAVRVQFQLPVKFTIGQSSVEGQAVHPPVSVSPVAVPRTGDEASQQEHVTAPLQEREQSKGVEVQPEFPGGMTQLSDFMMKNLRYPQSARDNNIQGSVVLSFIVETDGTLTKIQVLRSLDPSCDEEAMRVVSLMPKWKPGEQNGQPVRVQFQFPIRFVLSKPTEVGSKPAIQEGAQSQRDNVTSGTQTSANDSDEVFRVVDEQPEFPGGLAQMSDFLKKNLRYPGFARDNKIQGTVVVYFVVGLDGSLENIKITRSVDPLLDAEAIRVVSLMPKWKPGRSRGRFVRVSNTIPIKFTIAPSQSTPFRSTATAASRP